MNTQEIYNGLPVHTLLSEEERIKLEIDGLHERLQMIGRAIVGKYVEEQPAKPVDKWLD